MRRVPSFLPLQLRTIVDLRNGILSVKRTDAVVWMKFVLFTAPALIHGLLMTEILEPDKEEVERYFFGYQCPSCQSIFLVNSQTRREEDLEDWMRHKCDPSDIRRAVNNARRMGLDRNEQLMEGMNGRWWPRVFETKEELCPSNGKPVGIAGSNSSSVSVPNPGNEQ